MTNINDDRKVENLRDYRVVKDQAFEEGYSLRSYLSRAKYLGISRDELIKNSYGHKSIDDILGYRQERKKARKVRTRILSAALAPILLYTLNFGIMTGISEMSVPNNFHQQYSEYKDSRTKLRELENTRKFMCSGEYVLAAQAHLGKAYWNMQSFQPIAYQYEKNLEKAVNPLKYL